MTLLAEYGMYHCYHVTEAAGQVTEKELEERLARLKGLDPSNVTEAAGQVTEKELEERLARLKGLDPSKCTSNKPVSTTSPVIM